MDLVNLAMRRAVESFGGTGNHKNVFNAAGFSSVFRIFAGVENGIDGRIVEAILCGRKDVEQLSGGAHYRLLEIKP